MTKPDSTAPAPQVLCSAMVHGVKIEIIAGAMTLSARVTEPEARPDYAPDLRVHEVAFSDRDAATLRDRLCERLGAPK